MYQRMQAYEQCQTAGGNMEGDENFLVIQAMSQMFSFILRYSILCNASMDNSGYMIL